MTPPFKLRVDWLCWEHYGDDAVVELWVSDEGGWLEPTVIHRDNPLNAVSWARKWLEDRGFAWTCDINERQRMNDSYIILQPINLEEV
jgi:hypothetical protein